MAKPKTKRNEPSKISLKDIDFGFKKSDEESDEGEIKDEEDAKNKIKAEPVESSSEEDEEEENENDNEQLSEREKEELKKILDEENNALDELHTMLSKTRKRMATNVSIADQLTTTKQEAAQSSHGTVDLEQLDTIKDESLVDENAVVLDTISEFCRNIKNNEDDDEDEIYLKEKKSLKKKRDNENMEVDDDLEAKDEDEAARKDEDEEDEDEDGAGREAKGSRDDDEANTNILDDEPIIDRGVMSALKLAINKGYLGYEKEKQNARLKGNKAGNNIEAEHYTIEERNYYDIDDKYNRNRDKYCGPLVDFEEKRNYKPDVKLDYIDEKGQSMNEKEAFRYLSHRFHGKGPGKLKTEKRIKKFQESESMNKMSSVDTPLNTVALLVEKQKKLQQPYVLLSAKKGRQDHYEHLAK
jgi:U4/U6.U5 tri-snRNP-associated protein 1